LITKGITGVGTVGPGAAAEGEGAGVGVMGAPLTSLPPSCRAVSLKVQGDAALQMPPTARTRR